VSATLRLLLRRGNCQTAREDIKGAIMKQTSRILIGTGRPGRGRRWAHVVAVAAGLLTAVGVPGAAQSAALPGSSSALAWTKQHPAASPSARWGAAVAYDAATGTVVLFGGADQTDAPLDDTWVWDGSTWTEQALPAAPPAQAGGAMAYDAATGTVVLLTDGRNQGKLDSTWVWDGSAWAKRHPATSPPVRYEAAIAYDAATGTVVVFGGTTNGVKCYGDTWVWDGSTWTQQHPATSPSTRLAASMAYDTATGTVVLFGGLHHTRTGNITLRDTWVWDGSVWTKEHPAASPPAREDTAMTYDAASGTADLFGGFKFGLEFGDTWTWGSS
jgi:hypothetical protein